MTCKAALCLALLALPAQLSAQATPANAATTPAPASVSLPVEADRVLRDYETAWRARDAAKLAALFHPEGFVLSSGRPPAQGREAIRRHYDGAGGDLHLRAIGYAASDTIGYIVGMFRGAGPSEGGKFVVALRRSSVREPWLIAADMDNANMRPNR